MDNDIRHIINSLFSKNVNINEFGFVNIHEQAYIKSIPDKNEFKPENFENKGKKRCEMCHKKTGLDFFSCGDKIYCSNHRYHHTHNCNFDIQNQHKEFLKMNNPVVKNEKFEKI